MENLDKYFREKLENRQFELQDAYWQQAQELLAANERRHRRRAWFWWGGGAALVLLLGAAVFFLAGKNGSVKTSTAEGGDLPAANAPAGVQSIAPNDTTVAAVILPEKTDNEEVTAGNPNGAKTAPAFADRPRNPGREGKKTRIEQTIGEVPPANKQTSGTGDGAQTTAADSVKPPSSGAGEQVILAEADHAGAPALATGTALAPPEKAPADDAPSDRTAAPELLEALTIFVEGDFAKRPQTADLEDFAKPSPWSFAVEAGQIFQPTPHRAQQTGIGQQAGLLLRYGRSGANGFYLATGLRYQYRTGTFDFTKFNENRNYRFGLELDTMLLQPHGLHYLSVPVLVGRQRGRHVLEAGLSLDRLLGVRGEIGSIQRTGEPPRRIFQATERGWLVEDGYKKWTATAQLAYRFRVSRQWSFGLSANYTLGGILAPVENDVLEGRALLREDDKLYLGLQAAFEIR